MAWNTIAAGLIADADKLNENFNLVAGGSRQPRTSAGASFVPTDGAYDIGSENARWDELRVNEIDFDGSITTADKSLFTRISTFIISATASSIEFTSIDGDDSNILGIDAYVVTDTATSVCLIINGDSASNYGEQFIIADTSTAPSAGRTTTSFILLGKTENVTTASEKVFCNVSIYSKTGNERTGLLDSGWSMSDSYTDKRYKSSIIYNDTSNTITSLKIYVSDGNFETGSSFSLWGRK